MSAEQGWQPHHMVINQKDETEQHTITGILPLYLKSHSWGEYVFDWSWAQAFEEHNIPYYPKLVATIPLTPVTSDKLLGELTLSDVFPLLSEHCKQHNIHSWHILFCNETPLCNEKKQVPEQSLEQAPDQLPEDVYLRHTVQFNWFNRGYQSFDDFLSNFTARKRKNTRKERLSINEQGIQVRRIKGTDITEKELDFFYLTYQLTYVKKGHQPHLSINFFQQIVKTLADNILLIIATQDDEDIACAFFFHDD